jgi:hypothetical protein
MAMTSFGETLTREKTAAYGGFADAIGGLATVVLAIIGLARVHQTLGVHQTLLVAIAIIVFGVALMIQGGAMLSEYAGITFPSGATAPAMGQFGGSNLSSVFLAGGAGIIFGILALLGIEAAGLTAIALIVFGAALVLSSTAVWHLYTLKHAAMTSGAAEPMAGTEVLASQMASGSAGIQAIAGIAAVVLGILALAGTGVDSVVLILVGLLIVGITVVLSGSAWSGTVMSFMKETPEPGHSPVTSSPRPSAEWRREEH